MEPPYTTFMDQWPPQIRNLPTFEDENHFRNYLAKKLINEGWIITQKEKPALNASDRCDLIIYDKQNDFNVFLELKTPESFNDITKGLSQLIRYRKLDWGIKNLNLFAFITPVGISEGAIRFFWRFGFGVGSLDTETIRFNEGMSFHTRYHWTRSKEKLQRTIELMQKLAHEA